MSHHQPHHKLPQCMGTANGSIVASQLSTPVSVYRASCLHEGLTHCLHQRTYSLRPPKDSLVVSLCMQVEAMLVCIVTEYYGLGDLGNTLRVQRDCGHSMEELVGGRSWGGRSWGGRSWWVGGAGVGGAGVGGAGGWEELVGGRSCGGRSWGGRSWWVGEAGGEELVGELGWEELVSGRSWSRRSWGGRSWWVEVVWLLFPTSCPRLHVGEVVDRK